MPDPQEPTLAELHARIAGLSPQFLQQPGQHAQEMRRLVGAYVAQAQRSRERPDEALLAPIAAALGALVQAEDRADGADW